MWLLQTPDVRSPKLLDVLSKQAKDATRGGAAFAFATATGIKLLGADDAFKKLLNSGSYTLVVGLDAITDTDALTALAGLKASYPNLEPLAFVHGTPGSLFHPKTAWYRYPAGGSIITGSGNLTLGGLRSNWEASSVLLLNDADMDVHEASWTKWLDTHNGQLLAIDHPDAVARAATNKAQKAKIKKALKLPVAGEETDEEVAAIENAVIEADNTPVLIAEVPKSGDRWKQVNFDIETYQNFFGVTLGTDKDVEFRQVLGNGALGPAEARHGVAVKSQNYRFEVGAAGGLAYPTNGHPILVFEKISDEVFYYVLLMPGEPAHTLVQDYLNANYPASRSKRRAVISMGTLQAFWPGAPFFL
ncbi:MAG: phospholipase D family protein [Burkholderiales bacterium]